MKCPNCGNEVPKDHMYCDVCGKEIHIVPEFEPIIENKIDESLSGLVNKLDFDNHKNKADKDYKEMPFNMNIIIGIVVACIILIIIVFLAGTNSASHYMTLANQAIANNQYEEALEYLEKAREKSPHNPTVILAMAKLQINQGELDDAITTLHEIIDSENYEEDDVVEAYEMAIQIYESESDYESISNLISDCKYTEIIEEYEKYVPSVPQMTPVGGEFEEAISITISAEQSGDIYYTVNGRVPDEDSILYENEIILEESGTYEIQAIFINEYGIKSDVISNEYVITITGPSAPDVLEDSGEYNQNTHIVVLADTGCTVYYTTDGSDPDNTSTQYVSPITMPLGESTYKFVAIDSDGNMSEIVERHYHLVYTRLVSTEQAIANVEAILLKLDILLEGNKMRSEEGYYEYVFDSIIEIEGSGEYYKIIETHVYNDGTTQETGLIYAVNTHDGTVNRLGYDSSGNYTLITISNR